MSFLARPLVLWRAISRIVSIDSCLAVSMKEQVLTMRISASSGREVRRAPARSSRPIMTSESTRFFGQPKEINTTEGAAGEDGLVTYSLYRLYDSRVLRTQNQDLHDRPFQVIKSISAGSYAT